jgi:hypothetical protein
MQKREQGGGMQIDYLTVEIKATTDIDGKKSELAMISFMAPCETKREKGFIKAKDELLKAVKKMYSYEDQHAVDVSIEYTYTDVNQHIYD